MPQQQHALIVGAGDGLSASLARLLAREGFGLSLAARDTAKLAALCAETGAAAHACDAADAAQVAALFQATPEAEVVVYNPSYRTRGPITDLDPEEVRRSLEVCAFGAFLVAQQAARRMLKAGRGTIVLTGASAGVKGYPRSAPFAMGKFALRGLAESMARELQPRNIHVAHFVIDGGVAAQGRPLRNDRPDSMLDPAAIAQTYMAVLKQPRSAWTFELAVRPWVERF